MGNERALAVARPTDEFPPCYEPLDAVLEALSVHGPELRNGLFSHAPMVAEALCALGYGERAPSWIVANQSSFTPRPPAAMPIIGDDWPPALGDSGRFADWAVYFRRALAVAGWRSVLAWWSRRLAPGFTTAACHGAIRTAHAARALAHGETDARLHELADGLAAWAALYRELPVAALAPRAELAPADALAALTASVDSQAPASGPIDAGLAALRNNDTFAGAVARVDLSGDPASRADELVRVFAGLFVASARSPFTAVVFTHAVTGAAAARNLCPPVGDAVAGILTFRAWEAGCALAAAFGGAAPKASPGRQRPIAPAGLARRAVEHGDDHVIKLTEACLAAYRRHPDEVLLEAPARALALIPGPATARPRRPAR